MTAQRSRENLFLLLATPDYAILQGPPGSGKTTAIIELIAQWQARKACCCVVRLKPPLTMC